MRPGGFRVGKIFGIELWLDYSWFVLFFLIALTFTAGILPAQFPGYAMLSFLALGVIITALFFASVIVHELSHSLYAKNQGMRIRRITLFVFGGASEVEDEARGPRQEFVMAAVGPLASLALGVLFGVVWVAGELFSISPLIVIGSILSVVNFALGIFNLMPGFPMDGGRMFRAVVWKYTGDLEKATRFAAAGGRIFAFFLIAVGLAQLLFGAIIGGLWLVLIGFFLSRAATFSYQQTISRLLLKGVVVGDLMQRDFVSVPWATPIRTFLRKYVLRYKEASLPVQSDKTHPSGMVDARRLEEEAELNEKVGKFTVEGQPMLRPHDPATKALDVMYRSGQDKLPVEENGKLVGVLTSGRIRAYILGKQKLHKTKS